ncbi:hypothetical protein [Klebsiella sp. BIGb0407]|uniref:hypothetical protein n=1 Tax=Klebsiella sp. BIGb0407 TaxID=2940603 RepID=UPI0021692D87|nr:hypothetical protein [Klebsiella sp. BIGb0407]MCS3430006.1 hypothetical protein [Klebsiella sp. BIGb0407]
MNAMNEYFVKFNLENGKDITKEQLSEALVQNNYIYIDLYDGHWSRNIYIPDDVPLYGGIIYITSKATFKANVHVYDRQYVLSRTNELVVLGSPMKHWVAVAPVASLDVK